MIINFFSIMIDEVRLRNEGLDGIKLKQEKEENDHGHNETEREER